MAILVLAEHDNNELFQSTLNTIIAAQKIGDEIDVLVAGQAIDSVVSQAAQISGVRKVLSCDDVAYQHSITENLATLVKSQVEHYSHVVAAASSVGKSVIPYLAALCDVQPISDIVEVVDADTFIRPIYAGNALATVKSTDNVKLVTVRTSAFDVAEATGGNADIETIDSAGASHKVQFIQQMINTSDRPELTSASIVVSGGRGMKSGDNFPMLEKLADTLGGALGASRAAVDAGYVPNDYQVGQTGKVVAPDLYLAVGISGAIQHLAGMKDSKYIAAINIDPEAPIFQIADYSWCADLFDAIPELQAELEK